ncbi:GNAT family N-acetyltransferase [Mumia sp. zg.B53]|uniref:GNAT family N-acetyltransferase n=1 Tax=unclassified Mumia TaxID=2621872 RepID=UPI001C6E2940|nr:MULTISPECIES: GNAT family N-acetyltransferase [unclassified Mumia]MBW9204339.1 GNAT family N-acetyltransferase [Mumia sp. zg.B17]MBW9209676.1 GNAT family N-acetyltransferase [Mumia sp. zg.B21]MBW9214280.1 GNAT family N-acetyltransferase [Mumia sp. zg.B53]MDD9348489.1 GNAT family N-acetyltransferase [Mumia sp.]
MLVRRIDDPDLDAVLALNQGALEGVGPLTMERLEEILGYAEQAVVAQDADGALGGFALTLPPGTAYDSINYRWFCDELDDFSYVDRAVVAPGFRRRGIATMLYNVLEERARARELMALEVYVEPRNDASLAFHGSRGYAEVGRLDQADGKKAAMMTKQVG